MIQSFFELCKHMSYIRMKVINPILVVSLYFCQAYRQQQNLKILLQNYEIIFESFYSSYMMKECSHELEGELGHYRQRNSLSFLKFSFL